MVTVDDATYAKMKDTLYGGDAGKASKAKAQIESSYTDEQYNKFVNQLGGVKQQPTSPSNTSASTPADTQTTTPPQTTPEVKQETEVKQAETVGDTVPEIQQQGALKPLSQDYYNQTSQEAQDKIVRNLNDYKQSNPEYFTDYESFKRNFSYDARDDIQKNTLDEWYKGYQQGLEFSTTPVNDLYNQYNSGQLSATQLQSLRVTDPTKYAELQNQINKGNIIAAYDDDKGEATNMSFQDMAYQMMQKTFMQFMNGGSGSGATQFFAEYKDRMNSPEMVRLSDESAELQEQIENVQSDIANMKKAVEKEYEGTGATRSKINAIISDRTYELQTQLQTLDSQYKRVATQYNNRMQQYSNDFELQLQEYQLGMQERNQKMDELGFAIDLMSFETPQQQQERQWNYRVMQQEYENGNINSSDYQTRYKAALKSVQNLLSQYQGIPMKRSAEQMAQDILTAIDNGSDLGTELTKIDQQIQQKPEYKYLYNQTYKPATSSGIDYQTFKLGDQDYIVYNKQLYTAEDFNARYGGKVGGNGGMKHYNMVNESAFSIYALDPSANNLGGFLLDSKNANGKKGGQCAKFVNNYLEKIGVGRYFGNEDIKTREQRANSDTPKVGTIAIFDYGVQSSDGVNHGHVAIVTQVNSDGSFVVKESNYPSGETIGTRTVNANNKNLKGFFDPSQGARIENVSDNSNATLQGLNSNISAQDQQKAEGMLKQIKTGNMTPSETSNARDWLIENGYGDQFLEALDKGIKVSLTDTQQDFYEYGMNNYKTSDIVKDFKTAASQINNLITSLDANNGAGDLAGIFQFMKVLDPNSVVREQEFKNAASAAGYAKPNELWQRYVKHGWDGTWLSDAQRGNFKELAKNLIKSQAEMYNIEYSDLQQVFKNANIDDQWLPTNYADVIISKLDGKTTTQSTKQVSGLNLLKSSLNNMSSNMSQYTNFYQKYANTAPASNKTYNVNGYQVQR